ncbi:MAG TPA: 2,3-bisphosphoglycerate-independent phosphoglycerate mutase [Methylomusa anaerophila]|uniref:2,3-bisphosphoglycerate-independent phosphoglycerate mutase n=1 Tax=Methylomusa anaerophila TaxID=1930071 RepID=A0A348AL22_9FIRM|nr:2,3-bisphosphoglycerate-independent phosphoglycerate mutase [Methylomusa anaerophila]BBB91770.1 2,3-bisphosphoglycerate-independent phosphoglycerate mutase [Methylomusa anaerophila]HML88493.1 2,3-bisphosphoglycerate-independent phosphoglycerate mutase [Methylomusa anaerophila]
MTKLNTPIALLILDGWGLGDPADQYNAVARAGAAHMTLLAEIYPTTGLICSGEAVGLPDGQMGNSEVGHLNIGAGRVVYQELTRISKSIRDGDFFTNPVLEAVCANTKASGGALHLMGLLSDGGVHSHNTHLYALLDLAKKHGLQKVYVHAYLDGRDVPPASAKEFVADLEAAMAAKGIGQISTISGRYYAMDRDKRWERTEKAYAALVYREGLKAAGAGEAVASAYQNGQTDEFVIPTVITKADDTGIKANDGLIFFNFRPDRTRQMTRAFADADFSGFERRNGFFPVHFATMTQYDEKLAVPVAFPPNHPKNTLGEIVSKAGFTQLRIAETEKYAHVTYFFSGGEEQPFPGEDRLLIPSPKVATYDLKPEMSAIEVTDNVVNAVRSGKYDFIILNYANGDMVGHTGILDAAIAAVKTVDQCVGRVVEAMRERGGITLITADHGNAEYMLDHVTGEPFTAHTTNRVPFIMVSESHRGVKLREGILADIAPTILELAGIKAPSDMTGTSLIEK